MVSAHLIHAKNKSALTTTTNPEDPMLELHGIQCWLTTVDNMIMKETVTSSEGSDIVTCTVKLPARKCYIVHWQSKEPITAWCEIHTKGPTGKITPSLAKCEMDAEKPLTQVRSSREGLGSGRNLGFYGRRTTTTHLGMAWLEIRRATAIRVSEVTREERRLTIDWLPSDRPDVGNPHATFVFNFELTAPPPARSLSHGSDDPESEEEDELLSDHQPENGTPTDASHISQSPVISDSAPPNAQPPQSNDIPKRQTADMHSVSPSAPAKADEKPQTASSSIPKRLKRDSGAISPNTKQPSPKRPRVDRSTPRIDRPSPRSGKRGDKPTSRANKPTVRADKSTSRIDSPVSHVETPMPRVKSPSPSIEIAPPHTGIVTAHVEDPIAPIRIPLPPLTAIASFRRAESSPADAPASQIDIPTIPIDPLPPPPLALEFVSRSASMPHSRSTLQTVASEQQPDSEPSSPSEHRPPQFLDISDNDDEDEPYSAKIAKLELEINSHTEKFKVLEAKDAYMQVKREWVQLLADVRTAELACGIKPPKEMLVSDSDQEEDYIAKRKKLEIEVPMLKNRLVALKERKKYQEKKAKLKQLKHDIEAVEKRCDDASSTITRIIASSSPAANERRSLRQR